MSWFRRGLGGKARGSGDVESAVRKALRCVLEGDLDAAEELLSRAVRIDSDQVDAYLSLARLYRLRGEIGRAIRVHQNILLRTDIRPEQRDEALLGLAGDFRKGGFLQRSIAAYEEVLARDPGNRNALRALIRLRADVRDHRRAVELQRRLARAEGREGRSEEARLLVEMSEAAHAEGRSEEARRALRRALRRDPRCVDAWIQLGALEAERGRSKRALAAWQKVPELDRRVGPEVYPRLEATYAALGRAREFEDYLRRLLEAQPGDVDARLALARALSARGDTDSAIAEVGGVLERDSENLEAHAVLSRVLLEAGREAEAVKELGELVDLLERGGALEKREFTG
jgi:lipopolysaccharide biosynthesis regulator YciM